MRRGYADAVEAPPGYTLQDGVPSPAAFVRLREDAGMSPRSLEAAERGLPNTLYGVYALDADGSSVGLARVVGDGGTVYQISDVAVADRCQGEGLGTALMDAVMAYVRSETPETAYVNLLADVDDFYEQWGFEYTSPASKGMVWNPDRR